MDSFNQKLNRIEVAKNNIKQSLINKGIEAGDNLEDYSTLIDNIESGSSVKLFETQAEMKADTEPVEGDLALVYGHKNQHVTSSSQFQTATFPETVVLDTAITDYIDIRYRAVDSSVMFDCMGSLDSSRFRMDCYTESGQVRIEYTSTDGITYTRTDDTGNPVDFGTEIYYEMPEMWNDAIGKFIIAKVINFDGLYTYKLNQKTNKFKFPNFQDATITVSNNYVSDFTINSLLPEIYDETIFKKITNEHQQEHLSFYVDTDNNVKCIVSTDIAAQYLFADTSGNILGLCDYNVSGEAIVYDVDLENSMLINPVNYSTTNTSSRPYLPITNIKSFPVYMRYFIDWNNDYNGRIYTNNYDYWANGNSIRMYIYEDMYVNAPTQLTLTNSGELLSGKTAYGANGVVTGDDTLYKDISLAQVLTAQSINPYENYPLCEYNIHNLKTGADYISDINTVDGLVVRQQVIKDISTFIENQTYNNVYVIKDYIMLVGYINGTRKINILDSSLNNIKEIILPENTASENSGFYTDYNMDTDGNIRIAYYSKNSSSDNGILLFITISNNGEITTSQMNITDTNVLTNVEGLWLIDNYVILIGSYVFKIDFGGTSYTKIAYDGTDLYSVRHIAFDEDYVYLYSYYYSKIYVYNKQDFTKFGVLSSCSGMFSNINNVYICKGSNNPFSIYSVKGTTITQVVENCNGWAHGNIGNSVYTYFYYDISSNNIISIGSSSVSNHIKSYEDYLHVNLQNIIHINYKDILPNGNNIGYSVKDGKVIKYIINFNKALTSERSDYYVLKIDDNIGIIIPTVDTITDYV